MTTPSMFKQLDNLWALHVALTEFNLSPPVTNKYLDVYRLSVTSVAVFLNKMKTGTLVDWPRDIETRYVVVYNKCTLTDILAGDSVAISFRKLKPEFSGFAVALVTKVIPQGERS